MALKVRKLQTAEDQKKFEVVRIKKKNSPSLLIYIHLDCIRRSSWPATTLDTLVFMLLSSIQLSVETFNVGLMYFCNKTSVSLQKMLKCLWKKNRIKNQSLFIGDCSTKVLFTDRYTWQNFGLRFLDLVNRLYTVIHKTQKS